MRNWSTDISNLKKNPTAYKKWVTEQLLTYGMDEGDELDGDYLKENLGNLDIPEDMRAYLKFILNE